MKRVSNRHRIFPEYMNEIPQRNWIIHFLRPVSSCKGEFLKLHLSHLFEQQQCDKLEDLDISPLYKSVQFTKQIGETQYPGAFIQSVFILS